MKFNYSKNEIIKAWADFYKTSVEDKEFGEPENVTDEAGYNEFGNFMYETFNSGFYGEVKDDGCLPDGTEDRMFYRSYAIVKGLNNCKIQPNGLSCDDTPMSGYIGYWLKIGLIDTPQLISAFSTTRKTTFNPQTKTWNNF